MSSTVASLFPRLVSRGGAAVDVQQALNNKHVLLYFSASWCPDCAPVTPILKMFHEELERDDIALVYISSDTSSGEFDGYFSGHHGDWLAVPFDDVETRSALKRRYQVCAKKEAEEVGVKDRKAGIPTLIPLNASAEPITLDGATDVGKMGPRALSKWKW